MPVEKQLRKDARGILRAALEAADPREAVLRHARVKDDVLTAGGGRYPLSRFERVFVIGAGKAGAAMATAVEKLLGKRIRGGLVNVKYGHTAKLRRIELNECGHPVPDEAGVRGSRRIAEIAAMAGERDLLICLISGELRRCCRPRRSRLRWPPSRRRRGCCSPVERTFMRSTPCGNIFRH